MSKHALTLQNHDKEARYVVYRLYNTAIEWSRGFSLVRLDSLLNEL
jgi:hypothetical protein